MFEHLALGLLVRLVRPIGLALTALALAAPVSLRAQEPESVRVATFNAYLLSPIFKCGNPQFADCLLQINGKTEEQAKKLRDDINAGLGVSDIDWKKRFQEEIKKQQEHLRPTRPSNPPYPWPNQNPMWFHHPTTTCEVFRENNPE